MKYLSVCSGIEAASAAWHSIGWQPVAFSEIEPFPCSVLAHHFPDVPNLGDMTRFQEWDIEPNSIDVLVGGTPCQSFSIAGLRGGLTDGRGNLALTYCQILQKFRPRWFIWENVPGVLSSNGGRDFGSILGAMVELGYGIAYRILDAQHFGVPQRRRRVFIVGCAGDWECAAKVLFEQGCLRGNTPKGRKAKQNVAALTATGVGTCGADDNQGQAGHLIAHSLRAEGFDASEDGTGRGTPLVAAALTSRPYADQAADESKLVAYRCHGSNVGPMGTLRSGNSNETGGVPFLAASTGNRAHCLNAGGMGRQDYETETMIACTLPASEGGVSSGYHPVVTAYRTAGDGCVYDEGDRTAPLTTASDPSSNIVAFSGRNRGDDGRGYDRPPNITGAVAGTVDTVKPGNVAGPAIGVRRLTPRECERLQGFPDDWTLVLHRGKPAADGPRYKAIGNSMAVPVMRWIGKRIEEQA
jgi:DNA (cytosine-5)-methyltransferase 1